MVAGAWAILDSLFRLYSAPVSYAWTVFALLTLFSGTFAIKVPSVPAHISVSETFVFTAVLLFGTAPATLIVALDGLIISFWRKNRQIHRVLFNGAEPAISIWIASHVFFFLSGTQPLAQSRAEIGPLVLPLIVFTVVYFLLNSWLTAIAVASETEISAARVWRQHFLWLSLNCFGGASVAILIAARNTPTFDYSALSLIVPLLIITYLTFKTALQRVEDARSHVTQLNKLYLSTIETFAMWIDAKDQVTHGHIRRVQTCAVELAREIGLKDESLVKAVEAAALLHDMGKLAVPEHILNKPGKLTSGEFEKMKSHASIGAQILSSIDFPYPVVPIVRHHHENWDGSGYPDGLAGTDIPIGARILAVVDCYDALTSDRPYRPSLTDSQAISILLERRGSMYDPLVVDAFMHVHASLGQRHTQSDEWNGADQSSASVKPLLAADSHSQPANRNDGGVLSLYELARSLAGHAGLEDTAHLVFRHLSNVIPASTYVLFRYEPARDDLVAVHASGLCTEALIGAKVAPGAGVSGWVAANRRCVSNADARLEFSHLRVPVPDGISRAHSWPLTVGDSLFGVITLYTSNAATLCEESLKKLDLLAPHLCVALEKAVEFDRDQVARLRDKLTGLPRFSTAAQLVIPSGGSTQYPLVAIFLDVDELKAINRRHGKDTGDAVLLHLADMIRSNLRSSDLLLRCDGDEFVVLLTESDVSRAESVAARLLETLSPSSFTLQDGSSLFVRFVAGYAIAPTDGATVEELVDVARQRALAPIQRQPSTAIH